MSIAELLINLSHIKESQQASILSVLKMAMDTSETGVTDLLQVLEANTKIMEQSEASSGKQLTSLRKGIVYTPTFVES